MSRHIPTRDLTAWRNHLHKELALVHGLPVVGAVMPRAWALRELGSSLDVTNDLATVMAERDELRARLLARPTRAEQRD